MKTHQDKYYLRVDNQKAYIEECRIKALNNPLLK